MIPPFPLRSLVFPSKKQLSKHLRDHVLTPPESHAWGLIAAGEYSVLSKNRGAIDRCYRLRKELACDDAAPSETIEELATFYQSTASRQFAQSQQCGWTVTEDCFTAGLGTGGVFVIVCSGPHATAATIVTAYIPGAGSGQGVVDSLLCPDNPHARDVAKSAMRRDTDNRYQRRRNGTESRGKSADEGVTDFERELFYKVFRPAIQFVYAYQGPRQSQHRLLARIKEALPRRKDLKWDCWQQLRKVLRHDESI